MKPLLLLLSLLFATSTAVLTVRNLTLARDLTEAHSAIAELSAKPVVVQAAAVQEWHTEAPTKTLIQEHVVTQFTDAASIPEEVLEKAVADREEQRRQQRAADRERRRQEWENQTPEEREARQAAFRQAMQERAAERLQEFVEKTGLNETQKTAFDAVVFDLDGQIRDVATAWAEAIREGGTFGPDSRLQLIQDISSVILDSYAALDETLPENWREADGNFNILHVVGGEPFGPLFEAAQEAGINPGTIGSVMGTFMGGGQRGPRNQVGRGGPPAFNAPGGNRPPAGPFPAP